MKDDTKNPDPTIRKLKQLAQDALTSGTDTPKNSLVPELALFRVPSTRQTLIEEGQFSPEEVEALDQMAAAQANPEAEQTANRTKQRFTSGVRFTDTPQEDPAPEDDTPSK